MTGFMQSCYSSKTVEFITENKDDILYNIWHAVLEDGPENVFQTVSFN